MTPPSILVVEDQHALADALQRNLEAEGYRARIATRAAEALAAVAADAPDLLLLDLGLPDRDGFHVLETIRGRGLQCPVLILSARGLEADKVRGFRLGADDYVTKPFGVLELMARVAALLRRRAPAPPQTPAASEDAQAEDVDAMVRERFGLTDRQLGVARLLAEGYSNEDIARVLGISPFTARRHTEQVLGKLGSPSRARVAAILRDAVR
jgi:DNA-binding response OmpR family regulator